MHLVGAEENIIVELNLDTSFTRHSGAEEETTPGLEEVEVEEEPTEVQPATAGIDFKKPKKGKKRRKIFGAVGGGQKVMINGNCLPTSIRECSWLENTE